LQFPVEEFFKAMARKEVAAGRMDFSANLSMPGWTARQMPQTLQGQISLRGKNLALSALLGAECEVFYAGSVAAPK
jgi:hypothetical protein